MTLIGHLILLSYKLSCVCVEGGGDEGRGLGKNFGRDVPLELGIHPLFI